MEKFIPQKPRKLESETAINNYPCHFTGNNNHILHQNNNPQLNSLIDLVLSLIIQIQEIVSNQYEMQAQLLNLIGKQRDRIELLWENMDYVKNINSDILKVIKEGKNIINSNNGNIIQDKLQLDIGKLSDQLTSLTIDKGVVKKPKKNQQQTYTFGIKTDVKTDNK